MINAAAKIKQFIRTLNSNSIFSSKQLLALGKRETIDSVLCRLVKRGVIVRLAAGIFIVAAGTNELPGTQEIMAVKARNYYKRVLPADHAAKTPSKNPTVFYSDSGKTSFNSVHGRIIFKPLCPAKLHKYRDKIRRVDDSSKEESKSQSRSELDSRSEESQSKIVDDSRMSKSAPKEPNARNTGKERSKNSHLIFKLEELFRRTQTRLAELLDSPEQKLQSAKSSRICLSLFHPGCAARVADGWLPVAM